jgi:mono/diheme cytochrome c family protein
MATAHPDFPPAEGYRQRKMSESREKEYNFAELLPLLKFTMRNKISISLFIFLAIGLYLLLFPPRWMLNRIKQVDASPATGAMLVEKYGCRKCHVLHGEGALKAPNLDEAVKQETEETLYRWLANPRAMRPNTAMPNLHLSDSEIRAIIAYLKASSSP